MKTNLLLLPALALAACGPAKTTPDAGVDSSCGIDCVAQAEYGLLAQTCFEYTGTNLPTLGVQVEPVEELEGGMAVMPVTYKMGGQVKQKDYFTVRDGALVQVRREWPPGNSVSYQDDLGNLRGVTWLAAGQGAGEVTRNTVMARRVGGGNDEARSTKFDVSVEEATPLSLKTPKESFTSGLRLNISEVPEHASDLRRVLVRGTGFVRFSSPLDAAGGSTTGEYELQSIQTLPE
ncbi:MAG: hypothetical protein FJ086_18205, partial [Deltaproteobacteria bacterium]|nr:hypothetical protein [Deltaproteobacteria bacterium]